MKSLSKFTKEELEAELNRREAEKAPQVLSNIDWSEVINFAVERRDAILNNSYYDEDNIHYLYEEVLTTVFGKDYFEWENSTRGKRTQ